MRCRRLSGNNMGSLHNGTAETHEGCAARSRQGSVKWATASDALTQISGKRTTARKTAPWFGVARQLGSRFLVWRSLSLVYSALYLPEPIARSPPQLQNRAAGLLPASGLGASLPLMPVLLALSMASGSAFIALNVPRSTVPKSGLPARARPDGTVRRCIRMRGGGSGWWLVGRANRV